LNLTVAEAAEINADREKLKSIFLNLIDNGIKYSPVNGRVTVALEKAQDSVVHVTFKDNGPGVLPEDRPHIFKRFFRSNETRSTVSGSGLGLAIVQEFVAMHKGKISFASEPGKGTLFIVELPIY
jgi:signal transduction histidine kinase